MLFTRFLVTGFLARSTKGTRVMSTIYEERSVSVTEDGEPARFRYRLLRPAAVEPGKTDPLVLFLHGAGSGAATILPS